MFSHWLAKLRIRFTACVADREIISDDEDDLPRHLKAVGKRLDRLPETEKDPNKPDK